MKTFAYSLKQGVKNIVQNRLFSLAAVGTISTCLFLLGLFYVLLSNFQYMVHHAESSVGVTVFFEKNISQMRIKEIGEEIKACEGVREINYISAEQAWKKFKKEMYGDDKSASASFGKDNPLKDSASYEVFLKDVSKQKQAVDTIQQIDGVRKVNSSVTVAKGLNSFNRLIAYVSIAIIALLFFISLFLINSSVATGIHVRKEEIRIMKYIGATNSFISMPFLVEGALIGLLGAILPVVLLDILYQKIVTFILGHFGSLSRWLTFIDVKEEMLILVPVCIVTGVGIGLLGSVWSVKRHIRRR